VDPDPAGSKNSGSGAPLSRKSCQRWLTKRIKGMSGMQYSERLACLNLESLQIRRLKCDLLICYNIIHNEITILSDDFLVFSDFTRTREHSYKLFKGCSGVNAHKYFLSNRITEIWNALPSAVVEASSSIVFKRMLDCVDLKTKKDNILILSFLVFSSCTLLYVIMDMYFVCSVIVVLFIFVLFILLPCLLGE